MRLAVTGLLMLVLVDSAGASPLTLVSGNTEAFIGGVTTTIPFSAGEIAAVSDGSPATSLSFTSLPQPGNVIFGFDQTFEFDVSGLSNIQSITFTWTGRYRWAGNLAFSHLLLGAQEDLAKTSFDGFGSGSVPNDSIQTVSLSLFAGAVDPRDALASSLVKPGLAQFNIETELGSAFATSLTSLTLETIDVTADVQTAHVPEPATWLLLGTGLAAAGARRRSNRDRKRAA